MKEMESVIPEKLEMPGLVWFCLLISFCHGRQFRKYFCSKENSVVMETSDKSSWHRVRHAPD